jgi:hypothetical protein
LVIVMNKVEKDVCPLFYELTELPA